MASSFWASFADESHQGSHQNPGTVSWTHRQRRSNTSYQRRKNNNDKMNFWSYSFSYIFKSYQILGEKYSAHIYALCVMTVLLACNILSIFFITLSDNYLKSKTFKELVITVFGALLVLNALYFLKGRRYLKMVAEYHEMNSKSKVTMKNAFWIYFGVTIIVLTLTLF